MVISLVLMGFILLLMLSLSTLTYVELASFQVVEKQNKARLNALLGLQVALGQLQTTLGPDQRVSARADILSGKEALVDGRRYWTGVWKRGEEGDPEIVAWLVSGQKAPWNGNSATADEEVLLLSIPGGKAEEVWAPLVPVPDVNGSLGHYAYWVADEGIKVRYNLAEEREESSLINVEVTAPGRAGLDILPELSMEEVDSDRITQVFGFNDLPLVHTEMDQSISREFYHDMTFYSRSVLSDADNGGLKYDLTTGFASAEKLPDLGDGLPSLELFRSYQNLMNEIEGTEGNSRPTIQPRVQTATQHGVYPVLLLFRGNFGATIADANGNPVIEGNVSPPATLLFTMRPALVLANPYDVDLAPADYEFIWEDADTGVPVWLSYALQPDESPYNSSNNFLVHEFRPLEALGGKLRLRLENVSFRAGEVKIFTMAGDERYSVEEGVPMVSGVGGIGNFLYADLVALPDEAFKRVGEELFFDWENRFKFRLNPESKVGANGARTRFILKMGDDIALQYDDVFVGRITTMGNRDKGSSIAFSDALEYGNPARFQARPSQGGRNTFNVSSGEAADNRGLPWIANINFRSPSNTNLSDTFPNFQWNSHPWFHWHYWTGYYGNSVTDTHWKFETDPSGTKSSWGPVAPGMEKGAHFVTFFHIPRMPLLSLGQLQHVNASPEYGGTYSVGNSWASMFEPFSSPDFDCRLNQALWDRFFFSGIVDGDFLNPRMSPVEDKYVPAGLDRSKPEQVAAGIMVEGGFNVNSTSVRAWESLLASLRGRDIRYYDVQSESSPMKVATGLDNPLPRSPLPGGQAVNPNGKNNSELLVSQWNGFRNHDG